MWCTHMCAAMSTGEWHRMAERYNRPVLSTHTWPTNLQRKAHLSPVNCMHLICAFCAIAICRACICNVQTLHISRMHLAPSWYAIWSVAEYLCVFLFLHFNSNNRKQQIIYYGFSVWKTWCSLHSLYVVYFSSTICNQMYIVLATTIIRIRNVLNWKQSRFCTKLHFYANAAETNVYPFPG